MFKNKFIKLCKKIIITSLCLNFNISYANEFNDLVVFGDSLSDNGNFIINKESSKMVAGDLPVYDEYLSKTFTGKEIYPARLGGTNYAYTNASIGNIYPLLKNQYLNNNKIIPNNLYIIWIGGNDIPADSISIFLYSKILNILSSINNFIFNTANLYFWSINLINKILANNAEPYKYYDDTYYINNTINKENLIKPSYGLYLITIAKLIVDKGAKYVIIPNMYDEGLVPRLLFGTKILFKPISQLYWKHANKKDNIPSINYQGAGNDFITNNLINKYKKFGLHKLIYKISTILSLSTQNFNYYLDQELSKINGNHYVYMDIYSLFNEIIDNPKFYGFDDIILPACSFGDANSSKCKNKSISVYHDNKKYIFSDTVHPSPEMHFIFSQYMQSVFNAPVQISTISRQLTNLNNNTQDYLLNNIINFKLLNNNLNKILPFVSINENINKIGKPYDYNSKTNYNNSLNLGFNYGINSKLLIGINLNASNGNHKPYDNFKYRYNSQIIKLFTKYDINNNFWTTSNITLGRIDADDITRTITLGKGKHIEKSNTNGINIGINVTSGYNFKLINDYILTPYLSLNLDNYKIKSFAENNNNSTSMKYDKHKTTYKSIKIALRLNKIFNNSNSFIQLAITNPIDNTPIKIKSSLKHISTNFIREIYDNDKPNLSLSTGVNFKLKNNLYINTNLNYKINKNNDKQLFYSLGINKNF